MKLNGQKTVRAITYKRNSVSRVPASQCAGPRELTDSYFVKKKNEMPEKALFNARSVSLLLLHK